jgi:hypothetical protein
MGRSSPSCPRDPSRSIWPYDGRPKVHIYSHSRHSRSRFDRISDSTTPPSSCLGHLDTFSCAGRWPCGPPHEARLSAVVSPSRPHWSYALTGTCVGLLGWHLDCVDPVAHAAAHPSIQSIVWGLMSKRSRRLAWSVFGLCTHRSTAACRSLHTYIHTYLPTPTRVCTSILTLGTGDRKKGNTRDAWRQRGAAARHISPSEDEVNDAWISHFPLPLRTGAGASRRPGSRLPVGGGGRRGAGGCGVTRWRWRV